MQTFKIGRIMNVVITQDRIIINVENKRLNQQKEQLNRKNKSRTKSGNSWNSPLHACLEKQNDQGKIFQIKQKQYKI